MRKSAGLIGLLICFLVSDARGADWSGWTTVKGDDTRISGGVDVGWRKGENNFSEKGFVFYRVQNRFNEWV